jgi:hypothetical protein
MIKVLISVRGRENTRAHALEGLGKYTRISAAQFSNI